MAAYATGSAALAYYYCNVPPSPDQSLYDHIAWQGLNGVQWYVGSFDVTWPGNLLFHEMGIRLFGVHRWTARAFDFLLLQPAILAIFFFLKSSGLKRAAWAAAFLYPIIYVTSGPWMAGHRDIVAMHFLIGAAAILLSLRGRISLALFLSGLLVGFAVLLRPTYLAFAPMLLIAVPRHSIKSTLLSVVALGFGTLVIPSAFAIAGLMTGTLGAWFESGVGFVLSVYQDPALSRSRLAGLLIENLRHQFLWLAVIGFVASIFWGRLQINAVMIVGLILTVIISFIVQNKGFGYHLGGLIPVFVILALGGIEIALGGKRWQQTVAVVLASVFLFGAGKRALTAATGTVDVRENDVLEILSVIASESASNSKLFQWGWNYDVGFRAQRLSGSRMLDTPLFSQVSPYSKKPFNSWIGDFDKDLSSSKPAFILIDLKTLPGRSMPAGGDDSGLAVLSAHIASHYKPRLSIKGAILYKRVD